MYNSIYNQDALEQNFQKNIYSVCQKMLKKIVISMRKQFQRCGKGNNWFEKNVF